MVALARYVGFDDVRERKEEQVQEVENKVEDSEERLNIKEEKLQEGGKNTRRRQREDAKFSGTEVGASWRIGHGEEEPHGASMGVCEAGVQNESSVRRKMLQESKERLQNKAARAVF
ncbi:hypothetical protein NDU88_005995 [Pleurodeles waltl]|uniref:Uncharacterized protein n=1 Tax=Pleurodeles waltl TaxID=8319 RepID=A0AAV7PK54_PLEWA|nr:hypothetical protein NDU88_005995 [Pleurodeles waltl]